MYDRVLRECASIFVADPRHVDVDPDPTFHFDLDPDLTFKVGANPDPVPLESDANLRPPGLYRLYFDSLSLPSF
jgi:hypothetical protein